MDHKSTTKLISWQQLAPIFADVVVSPWNLLVGGLLIHSLSAKKAIFSIVIGYIILAVVFVLYGGLGYKKRQESSQILSEVFGGKIGFYLIPIVLAAGQLGWAAINIDLGGRSLAAMVHVSPVIGMISYAFIIGLMASLSFHRLGITKLFVLFSSTALIIYLTTAKLGHTSLAAFATYNPLTERSLLWGISVVVASMASFATVTPDFFKQVRHKSDIVKSTLIGLVFPGTILACLGCFLFFDQEGFNLITLIGGLSFSLFPHLFNSITNTDGSIALYTPALKIVRLVKINLRTAICLATSISLMLALFNLTYYLESWLRVLSVLSPILIGVAFAAVVFNNAQPNLTTYRLTYWIYGITILISVIIAGTTLPVLFALLLPLLLYSLYMQYRFIHHE